MLVSLVNKVIIHSLVQRHLEAHFTLICIVDVSTLDIRHRRKVQVRSV
jgi:hypothetical protein